MDFGPPRQCLICYRPAYCHNYGALTCDACKMFFRRIVKEKLEYDCKSDKKCYEKYRGGAPLPSCKACRFDRCSQIGMMLANRSKQRVLELKNEPDDRVSSLLTGLLYADSERNRILATCFTIQNPSLKEMVEDRKLRMSVKIRNHPMDPSDWSFFALYTSIHFLLDLDFMRMLETSDKVILLKEFTGQASLFAGAMRTFREKRDKLMTVDGKDIYPDHIGLVLSKFSNGDDQFLHRIRSLLVNRLIELKITSEEFVLVTVLLFCNPALPGLSEPAKSILSTHQKTYSSVLLQYCQLKYQRFGPSRFTDLLSVCNVIRRNFEDVQYLTMVFSLTFKGVKYRKIVEEVI